MSRWVKILSVLIVVVLLGFGVSSSQMGMMGQGMMGMMGGMLSVNGYSGDIWYHTWHGMFISEVK